METIHEMAETDNEPEHWVYAKLTESPDSQSPCAVVYDYYGPYHNVMLPNTLDGLPVVGVSLLLPDKAEDYYNNDEAINMSFDSFANLSLGNKDYTPDEEDLRTLHFPPSARWLHSGDFWAELAPLAGADGMMMKRENPEERLFQMYGARCVRICAAMDCAVYAKPCHRNRILFMDRLGPWAEADVDGQRIYDPHNTSGVFPEICRGEVAYSVEDIRSDAEKLGEHGKLSYYSAYCYDCGYGTDVVGLFITRNGEQVTIESECGSSACTVRYEAFRRGILAEGLDELMRALWYSDTEWDIKLLEPRYYEEHNIPCRPEEEMPKEAVPQQKEV